MVAALMGLAYTLSYLDRQVLSLLVQPIKESLHLSDTEIGLAQGLSFSLFYVAASLPLAWLADRTKPSRVISGCLAFWSVMTMLCGFATNFLQLFLCRVGVAVGESGLTPAALSTLADRFDARRLATATAMFMLAPYVGGGLALLGGGALYGAVKAWDRSSGPLAGFQDWQLVFVFVGAPGLLVALLALLVRDLRAGEHKSAAPSGFSEAFILLKTEWRFTATYALAMAITSTLLSSYVTWLPAAIMRSKGVDEQTVGIFFGPVYLLAGACGTISAGVAIMMRGGADPVMAILRYMRATLILLWPVATFGVLVGSFLAELAMMGCTLFLVASILSLSSLTFQHVTPRHLRSQSLALLAMVAALFGTGLGPIFAGVMSDQFTFAKQPLSLALAVLSAICVPLVFVLLAIASSYHRKRRLDLRVA
jgi:MFS family permease